MKYLVTLNICLMLFFSKCEYITLDASPTTVCQGDPVELVWDSKSMTDLSFTTEPEMDLDLPSSPTKSGSLIINPESSGTVSFRGKYKGATRIASKEIRVLRSGESDVRLFSFEWGGCVGESAGIYKSINDLSLGGSIVVQGVTNQSSRRIRITHKGTSAEFSSTDTSASSIFTDLPIGGDWNIELLDLGTGARNEGCPPRERTTAEIFTDPPSIPIAITYGCR